MACFGHFRELNSLEQINFETFHVQYSWIPKKKAILERIKNHVEKSERVIIATDDDREGEAIGWHLCQVLNLNIDITDRIIFHEITHSAVNNAILHPRRIHMPTVYAQQARQILDIMIGYTISPVLQKSIKSEKPLSAGRCQTPALHMVYENEIKCRMSSVEQKYETFVYLTKKQLEFIKCDNEYSSLEMIDTYLIQEGQTIQFNITECQQMQKKYNPPKAHNTSSLQQAMRQSPKETMAVCQQLYEKGHITYMRTESREISNEFKEEQMYPFITEKYGERYVKTLRTTNKKNKTTMMMAHEAIRPTNIRNEHPPNISKKEQEVYDEIYKQSLMSVMSDSETNVIILISKGNTHCEYKYECETYEFKGWRIIENTHCKNEDKYEYCFNTFIRDNMNNVDWKMIYVRTQLDTGCQHYTEANLVQMLESAGIGRPSTFASLVDKIQMREYVKIQNIQAKEYMKKEWRVMQTNPSQIVENSIKSKYGEEKKKLILQPIGEQTNEYLYSNFDDLFRYEFTKEMEDKLDEISHNTCSYIDVCNEFCSKVRAYEQTENTNSTIEINVPTWKYKRSIISLKNGRYGMYAVWKKKNYSMRELGNRPIENIRLEEVIEIMERHLTKEK
jgi:DNA topoisomerase-1